jgi:hypothetical protein
MEHVVSRRGSAILSRAFLLVFLAPAAANAQPAAPAASSRLWLVAGGAFATVRGDCQTCEQDTPYRHAASVLANIGYRVSDRMDVGAELFWMPVQVPGGHIRATHVDAVAQYRLWASQGFFLKGGAGMAFVRNWVDAVGPSSINQKALSVVIGAGWAFRPEARVGVQIFGSQHAGAIGDLQTAGGDVPDVMGNFWSFGAGLVIR